MAHLPLNPTLSQIQHYVQEIEHERGFIDCTIQQECLLLGEEVGELFKAIRKDHGVALDQNCAAPSVENEFSDILTVLCSIANRCGVDIEKAFREKEKINAQRVWKTQRFLKDFQ